MYRSQTASFAEKIAGTDAKARFECENDPLTIATIPRVDTNYSSHFSTCSPLESFAVLSYQVIMQEQMPDGYAIVPNASALGGSRANNVDKEIKRQMF